MPAHADGPIQVCIHTHSIKHHILACCASMPKSVLLLPRAVNDDCVMRTHTQEGDEAVERVLAVEVLHLLRAPGAYSISVNDTLGASEVWQAYKHQKHDLFLPSAGDRLVSPCLPRKHPSSVAECQGTAAAYDEAMPWPCISASKA